MRGKSENGQTLADLVRRHACIKPTQHALSDGDFAIDYISLETGSDRFANKLKELGCQPGDRVVLYAYKRTAIMVAVLGVFKCGATLVPLDVATPEIRLQFIAGDISPRIILIDRRLLVKVQSCLPPDTTVVLLDENEAFVGSDKLDESLRRDLPAVHGHDSAYCIYTSGSTGFPKGVLISHSSVMDFFEGAREFYDVDSESRCLSFSPFHVDAFLFDMLLPLHQGASLYMYCDVAVPDIMLDVIKRHSVTHFAAFGRLLDLLCRASSFDSVDLPDLETVLTGADVPNVQTVQKWLAKGRVKVINAYGPTETTCAVTAHVITELERQRREPYPIGRAFKHATTILMDEGGIVRTPGIQGELYIGGSQVMKGYCNNVAETTARVKEINGSKYYYTGDMCTLLADGSLLFRGRRDDEVNISGFRIHLSEIRRVLDSIIGIDSSEVLVLESKHGERIIVAAVLLESTRVGNHQEILGNATQQLAAELPRQMIPRRILTVDAFPYLATGKVDRRQLSATLSNRLHYTGQEHMNGAAAK